MTINTAEKIETGDMKMRVNLYSKVYGSDSWDFEDTCDAAECFPDDPDSLDEALKELTSSGEHIVGGGAAPLFKLVKVPAEKS